MPSHDCFQRCAPTFSTYKNFVAAITSGGGVGSGSGVGIRLPIPEKLRGGAGLTDGAAVGIRLCRRWLRLGCFLPGTATGAGRGVAGNWTGRAGAVLFTGD